MSQKLESLNAAERKYVVCHEIAVTLHHTFVFLVSGIWKFPYRVFAFNFLRLGQ